MSSAANTVSSASFVDEARDAAATDEPSASEWAAMQAEAALDAFVAAECDRRAA